MKESSGNAGKRGPEDSPKEVTGEHRTTRQMSGEKQPCPGEQNREHGADDGTGADLARQRTLAALTEDHQPYVDRKPTTSARKTTRLVGVVAVPCMKMPMAKRVLDPLRTYTISPYCRMASAKRISVEILDDATTANLESLADANQVEFDSLVVCLTGVSGYRRHE
jgi:hypothetical protein